MWPPEGAAPVGLDGFYARLAGTGSDYGPAFQGLAAAWRRGSEVFAEVALPDGTDPAGFALHPALLDAALQAVSVGTLGDEGQGVMPFSWRNVALYSSGADHLRVRLADLTDNTNNRNNTYNANSADGADSPGSAGSAGSAVSVQVWDPAGTPVASAESLAFRPRAGAAPRRPRTESLLRTEWTPVPAAPLPRHLTWALVGDGAPDAVTALSGVVTLDTHPTLRDLSEAPAAVPDRVLVVAPSFPGEPARATRSAAHWTLEQVQGWLADERSPDRGWSS
ncbi:polyketide synthase dehydratase domain-containing protein [Streptomyces albus]